MEKDEIVKIFLDKGYMIDNASLGFFINNQPLIQPFLENYSELKEKPGLIDLHIVQELLKIKVSGVQVLKTAKKKQKISVSDQASFFHNRYESIKKIMNGRLDLINLVSINKISQKAKKFSIIGIVKEKKDESKSIILEDTTGQVEIFFSENFLPEYNSIGHDDILGFVCANERGRYYYTRTIWPDIPLTREIKKPKDSIKCLFVSISDQTGLSRLTEWVEKSADSKTILFLFSQLEDPQARKLLDKFPNSVEKFFVGGSFLVSVSGLKIFLSNHPIYKKYREFFNTSCEATITNLLKRRNMNPNTDFDRSLYEEDPFILDDAPDVVAVSSFDVLSIANYKGTNILLLKEFGSCNSVLVLDTKTRDVTKVEIS